MYNMLNNKELQSPLLAKCIPLCVCLCELVSLFPINFLYIACSVVVRILKYVNGHVTFFFL
jgi:hypothetical protein